MPWVTSFGQKWVHLFDGEGLDDTKGFTFFLGEMNVVFCFGWFGLVFVCLFGFVLVVEVV